MDALHRLALKPSPLIASRDTACALYHSSLSSRRPGPLPQLQSFLKKHLSAADNAPGDLPPDVNEWPSWVAQNVRKVGDQYASYLEDRHAGAPRRFFTNKTHALYFLQHVAPSKLVDGAWLYSAVNHHGDWRYHSLIRTYLEELGDGDPALNHVVLYRKLLDEHDCAFDRPLPDDRYLQGALQLALGYLGEDYLPEVIGYNLGYEQLPLHLLITAFELNELGVDPYYFTLHVTIDNASSGHAKKAVDTVKHFLETAGDPERFLARVRAGYNLNDLGAGSVSVINSFDIESEIVDMLETKRSFGQHMHSDYCRLEGRTINEWLSIPGQSRQFLTALEKKGWIERDRDPSQSRFWQLIDGAGALMFGVFNGYEKQLIHDWIAGAWAGDTSASQPFRARFRRHPASAAGTPVSMFSTNSVESLIFQISPALHHTPQGLSATKAYGAQLAQGLF